MLFRVLSVATVILLCFCLFGKPNIHRITPHTRLCDDAGGGKFIDIAEAEGLHLSESVPAHIRTEVDGSFGSIVAAAYAAEDHQDGHTDHQKSHGYDVPGVLIGNTAVDDVREELWHDHFADDLDDHHKRSQNKVLRIRLNILKPSFHSITPL